MTPLAMLMAVGLYTATVATPAAAEIDLAVDLTTKHASIAPFRAPSREHPLGTIAIAGVEDGAAIVIEWDLAENREIHRKKIADDVKHATMTSNEEHLFVAVDADRVVLVELDASLGVVDRREVGIGDTPSVAVNDKWLVVGYFEERQPTSDSITSMRYGFTTHHAMHVVTFSRSKHAIAGSNVFVGPHMLVPPADPAHSTRAIAIRGDAAYLALPSAGEVTIEAVKLPSLARVKQKTFDKLGGFGASDVELSGDDLHVQLDASGEVFLSTELVKHKGAAAVDAWNHALDGRACQRSIVTWNHRVTICQPLEGERYATLFAR